MIPAALPAGRPAAAPPGTSPPCRGGGTLPPPPPARLTHWTPAADPSDDWIWTRLLDMSHRTWTMEATLRHIERMRNVDPTVRALIRRTLDRVGTEGEPVPT